MIKSRLFLSILGLLIAVSSCTKPNLTGENFEGDSVYYIKYASDGFKQNTNEYAVTYVAEDGTTVRLSDFEGDNFERTIGPVSKGFKAEYSIKCTSSQYINHAIGLRIEVKEGDKPFVVKKEEVKTSVGFDFTASLSYIVE